MVKLAVRAFASQDKEAISRNRAFLGLRSLIVGVGEV